MNARAEFPLHAPDANVDRGYIGKSEPRANARRLLQGRGVYVDDVRLPRIAHAVFFRSPYAHARLTRLDLSKAATQPGVIGVFDGRAVAEYCTPWVGVLGHMKGMKSPPQHAIAIERACWQGEAVAVVAAETRAQAEDALAYIEAEWEELPVVTDMQASLAGEVLVHPELGDNICFQRELVTEGFEEAWKKADVVVEETYDFARHTGVCMESRSILADYNAAEHSLTVYQGTQAPQMMQDVLSRHLGIPESNVRVICKDIGGAFGIKVHVYPDEMATAALSVMLRRPVKFVADRLESFVTDIHAREHRVTIRLACTREGEILAFDVDDLTAVGPYSVYPRTSGVEGTHVVMFTGAPYRHKHYRAKMHAVFTNKNVTCQFRGVGQPIATAVTEAIVDLAAERLGIDPAEFRRRNLIPDDAYPYTFPSGIKFEKLSHQQALDKLLALMEYPKLRAEQAALRAKGVYRGIGLAPMIDVCNPSPVLYGVGGARITVQDGATMRLDPAGMITCMASATEQGQGTEGMVAQIAASVVGVTLDKVRVITGDTGVTPYGGEAVLQAGKALRANILDVAVHIVGMDKSELDIAGDQIVHRLTGESKLALAELGRIAYFRPDTLPMDFQPELTVTRHVLQREYGYVFSNGIQASLVEVDVETGFVKLLKHWCVEDCGTVVNPMLVDEQVRGGVVQGIGAALYEHCLYDENGQLLNASMADYLVPMAGEMPDIVVAHIETPTKTSELGAKGVGEAGIIGAPAAVLNAINDALSSHKARVTAQPATPERILQALGTV
jgi:carbon-monoxide dehydrogenase large subunit